MWLKWLPWKWIVRRLATSHGFLDPIGVLSYVRRFSQPSEVQEPIELLRAGVVLHARGLMNSRAIQHNLDWVWPYWVERQFDPADEAFIPRSFSLTHINLTHRNWTAVGLPDIDAFPLVDPAGAVTPLTDGWSVEGWIVNVDGALLAPSREKSPAQRLELEPNLKVVTETSRDGMALESQAWMDREGSRPVCRVLLNGEAESGGWLVVTLRPCNPEGVSFIHKIERTRAGGDGWKIDGEHGVEFATPIERHVVSTYRGGDVAQGLIGREAGSRAVCDVGLATAAALYRLDPGRSRRVEVRVPLPVTDEDSNGHAIPCDEAWRRARAGACKLQIPDERMQFLFDAAVSTMILHSPGLVYPGPYTYRRFWFRDAAFILNAMLMANLTGRCGRVLDHFPSMQTAFGYFHSQEGEWDSNGEALWIMERFLATQGSGEGRPLKSEWNKAIVRGAHWIARKRLAPDHDDDHGGLLPAGFSAEHLGPNDYYYWDDFWSVAGLRAAARMLRGAGEFEKTTVCEREAVDLMRCIEKSLDRVAQRLGRPAIPAAPTRRLDAGAIGSLVPAYPAQLWPPDDPRILDTVEWLIDHCFQRGGFFQDMVHSGINAYLTLHIAQVLLRRGDGRFWDLMRAVAGFASPTGQWPEAIHPRTGGGCMGDGQHVWAAAEWVAMLRNCFVLEEEEAGRLILGAGISGDWLASGEPISLGPTPTRWGPVTVRIETGDGATVRWDAQWHARPPAIEVRLPGRPPIMVDPGTNERRLD
jgi:hypothetical protein